MKAYIMGNYTEKTFQGFLKDQRVMKSSCRTVNKSYGWNNAQHGYCKRLL